MVFHHHALDSIDKDFVADPLRFVFLNGRIQIARGDGKNQYITGIHDRLHVRGDVDAAGVKLNALDVNWGCDHTGANGLWFPSRRTHQFNSSVFVSNNLAIAVAQEPLPISPKRGLESMRQR